jgi:acyl-CoA dehydrogenase
VREEIEATQEPDGAHALRRFDRAFFGHVGFIVTNVCRALWLGLSEARLARVPGDAHTRRYYQQLTRMSAGFAIVADTCMLMLGGALKRRELLSARLGDILSQMYLACAALKRYHDAGAPADDLPLLHWGVRDALYRIQEAFFSLFCNLPNQGVAMLLRWIVFPLGRLFRVPPDSIGRDIARTLSTPGPARERLTRGAYIPADESDPIGTLEAALRAVIAAEPVEAKILAAVRGGTVAGRWPAEQVQASLAAGIIDAEEAQALARAAQLRRKAIMVDDFPRDLGVSELHQTTEPVTFESLRRAFDRAQSGVAV